MLEEKRLTLFTNGKADVASSFLFFHELSKVTRVRKLLFEKPEVKR
jgi:hypothetical protein